MSEALHVTQQTPITLVYIASLHTFFASILTSDRPVGLKEAALDSPTFRSGVSHFLDQLELVEKWLEGLVRSINKVSHEINPLETAINGLLVQLAPPPNISEVIIDHDYTLFAARRYAEGAKDLWTSTISGMRKMETNIVDPIRSLVQNDLRAFKVGTIVMMPIRIDELILGKETRRSLEQAQKTFDGLLYRYSAQAKSKELSSLREDAFQLHEARRAYLKASMDFSVMAPQLRMTLDKVIVRVFSDQWREMRSPRGVSNTSIGRWGSDIERVRGWSREMENGEKIFRKELQSARKQIEDSTELRIRPSRELEDYAIGPPSSIGSKGLSTASLQAETFPSLVSTAKQGWLNLRTLTGKPAKTIWLRRWFFVKNGIFGWLVQGSRSGGVEESDRIGVLLCSIRPAQSEERRFTFEVKTKDLTIILQAETQKELIEWMRAFEVAKRKALEDPASTDSLNHEGAINQDPAFAISSPSAPEFAASATDSGNQQLGEDGSVSISDRVSTLPLPGLDNLGLPNRTSSDISTHRRSTGIDRDIESGRDHAARIIQKLDLHRKSAGGPQLTSSAPGAPPWSPGFGTGGIASLIAASHNVMPVGPVALPQAVADNATLRISGSTGVRDLPSNTLAPNTLINVPAPTTLSAIAVVVSGERGIGTGRADASGGMPSGVMANIWGSSNWGYLNRLERGEVIASQRKVALHPASPQNSPSGSLSGPSAPSQSNDQPKAQAKSNSQGGSPAGHRKSTSLPAGSNAVGSSNATVPEYPNHYPVQLKTQDAQFRLLFPNAPREERLLLVFRATWSLNDQQEFPGRVYVTGKDIFFYSHHLGMVLISSISLSSVSEVTAAPGRDYDLLFIHLKEASSNIGSTRITVKTFLEPLGLLQRRLNLLVTSYSTEQPSDIEVILKSLIKLEQDDPASSPSLESWEDLAAATNKDESNGRHMWQKTSKDLRAAITVDRGLYGDSTRSEELREATKIKLPRQPVEYVPSAMDHPVVEKLFDISPKALFHVMFGDRSAVWQLLYHERRAQNIRQGSWTHLGQSHLRREFEYQIEYLDIFRRLRTTAVIDYQMIDVFNDHLCYVVTDRKTPWHLPYRQKFTLLTKIIITHFAKSKCKLAIYIKVDWVDSPRIVKGLITNQALKDLTLDALDLADVIADQVRRLGAQSRTKKSIQIFGHIGVQTQASEFAGGDVPDIARLRRSVKRRMLTGILVELIGSLAESFVTSVMLWILAFIRWVWKTFNANTIILVVLAASVAVNVMFSSTTTSKWLADRRAGQMLHHMGIGPNPTMSRAIHLRDLIDATTPLIETSSRSASSCRDVFDDYIGRTNLDAPDPSTGAPDAKPKSQPSGRRFRNTQERLRVYRHDLLVAIRFLNSIERELIKSEWESWVRRENSKCSQAAMMIDRDQTKSFGESNSSTVSSQNHPKAVAVDISEFWAWHESYCGSCRKEHLFQQEQEAGRSALDY